MRATIRMVIASLWLSIAMVLPIPAADPEPAGESPSIFAPSLDPAAIDPADIVLPEMMWGPLRSHPEALGANGEAIVDRFAALIKKELLRPEPTDPCRFVDGFVECLRDEGLSDIDLARTLDRIVRLTIPFEPDQTRALDHVWAFAPDVRPPPLPEPSSNGVVRPASERRIAGWFETVDAAGSPFGIDLLPRSADEAPLAPGSVVPPLLALCLYAPRDFRETREVDAEVTVEVRCGNAPGEVVSTEVSTRSVTLAGDPDCGEILEFALRIPSASTRPTGRIEVLVDGRVVERDPAADRPPVAYAIRSRFRLERVEWPDGVEAFRAIDLDHDGRDLPRPNLTSAAVAMAFRSILFYAKDPFRAGVLAKHARLLRQRGLVGSRLGALDLAWDPAGGGPGRIAVPSQGRVLVVLGASWCQPCRALEPAIESLGTFLSESGFRGRLIHLSVEDDDDLPAHVADETFVAEFPNGVVAEEQQRALAVDAVPRYLVVEAGRIVETGTLSEEVLERLEEAWRADRAAAP